MIDRCVTSLSDSWFLFNLKCPGAQAQLEVGTAHSLSSFPTIMATLDLSSGRKEQSVYIQACVRGAIDGDTFQVSPLVVPKAVRLILKSLPPRRRGALETMGDGMFQVVTTVIFLSICPNPLYGKHFFVCYFIAHRVTRVISGPRSLTYI